MRYVICNRERFEIGYKNLIADIAEGKEDEGV